MVYSTSGSLLREANYYFNINKSDPQLTSYRKLICGSTLKAVIALSAVFESSAAWAASKMVWGSATRSLKMRSHVAHQASWDAVDSIKNQIFFQKKEKKRWFFNAKKVQSPTFFQVVKSNKRWIATAVALTAVAAAFFYIRRSQLKDCQPVNFEKISTQELEANKYIADNFKDKGFEISSSTEYLKLCRDDLRKKALWLTAKVDHNRALQPKHNFHLYSSIAKERDFKYAIISSVREMCDQIRGAAKMGGLDTVVINAHGAPDGISLSEVQQLDYSWELEKFYSVLTKEDKVNLVDVTSYIGQCFSGLSKDGRIFLQSCSTGANVDGRAERSFAAGLAKITKRQVIAAKGAISGGFMSIKSLNPFVAQHLGIFDIFSCYLKPLMLQDSQAFVNCIANSDLMRYFGNTGQLEGRPITDYLRFSNDLQYFYISSLLSSAELIKSFVRITLMNRALKSSFSHNLRLSRSIGLGLKVVFQFMSFELYWNILRVFRGVLPLYKKVLAIL